MLVSGSADWLGINYYYGFSISNRVTFPYGIPQEQHDGSTTRNVLYPFPQGLRSVLNYAYKKYKVPIVVTENGLAMEQALWMIRIESLFFKLMLLLLFKVELLIFYFIIQNEF